MMLPESFSVRYLACDPGETNGIALYDIEGKLLWFGQIPLDSLTSEIYAVASHNELTLIIESYRVFPQMAQKHIYNDLKTVQAIGRLKAIAEILDLKVIEQPATIKKIAFKYMGSPTMKKKEQHQWDAHAHGTYYLVNKGILDLSELS